jgi:hypothetical protein
MLRPVADENFNIDTVRRLTPPILSLWLIILCYLVFHLGGGTSTAAFRRALHPHSSFE